MNLFTQKNIILGVCAILVIGTGTFFYQQANDLKDQSAKSALYQIDKTLETETAALTADEKVAGAHLDVDAKFPKTVAELKQLISAKTETTRGLHDAAIKLGELYLQYSNDESLDKGIAALKVAEGFAKSNFQKASTLYILGNAQERAKQFNDAADSFQKALALGNDALKNELLLSLVRINMKQNNATQAKNFSDKLNKESPGSHAAQEAQKMISKT